MLSLDDIYMTSILFHSFQRGEFTDVRGCFSYLYPSLLRQDAESSLQVTVQSGDGEPGLRHQLGSFCSLDGMGCHRHTLSLGIRASHSLGTIETAGDNSTYKAERFICDHSLGYSVHDDYCFRVAAKQSIMGKASDKAVLVIS